MSGYLEDEVSEMYSLKFILGLPIEVLKETDEVRKKLHCQAYDWYLLWNEAELIELFHHHGRLSPQMLFRQCVELWSFARHVSPQNSPALDLLRMSELEDCIFKVKTLETWRLLP